MSEQRILGVSGLKQSGKNTCCNFIAGMELKTLGIIKHWFLIDEEGKLQVSDLFGNEACEGNLDLNRRNPDFDIFAANHLFPYVKVYSFADLLKEEVCMKILGLTYEQCYGSDEDKNTLTHLRWENMPGVFTTTDDEVFLDYDGLLFIKHAPGPMTAREVMQFVGTDIFRNMYNNVWVDATLRRIREENSLFALICDCRFPNEVDGILNAGGKVIRLTRNIFEGQDLHSSETALNEDKFDWSRFSAVIDNQNMNINQQNVETFKHLQEWGWGWPVEIEDK